MITPRDLAQQAQVKQPAVSTLDQRTARYVSSLRSSIEAAGGRLWMIAEFPGAAEAIPSFCQVGASVAKDYDPSTAESAPGRGA